MDEVADPIILAYQLGATGSSDWAYVKELAGYLVANGPYTPEERWEENGGYSPATMAAEIAGLLCAASIAEANGDQRGADLPVDRQAWASEVDNLDVHDHRPVRQRRLLPAHHPGRPAERGHLDQHRQRRRQPRRPHRGRPELPRTGPAGRQGAHRHRHHQHRSRWSTTSSRSARPRGRSGTGTTSTATARRLRRRLHRVRRRNPWPVLTGERGEYDVADGNMSGAQSMLADDGRARPTPGTRSPSRSGAARPAPAGSPSASRTTPPPR